MPKPEWGSALHEEEFHSLYTSSNVIRMMKLRKIRWAVNVVLMGRQLMHRNV
jgi:hypothetical protein